MLGRTFTHLSVLSTCSPSISQDVTVGFNSTTVEFGENVRSAVLTLVVNGLLERSVTLQLATQDGTATGTYM